MSGISRNRSQDTFSLVDSIQPAPRTLPKWRARKNLELRRADAFNIRQLVDAYNQTRVDYIVPMPMSVSRLNEYIKLYDIDLSASWVALKGKTVQGLGMLGLRENRAWITRVGVLPSGRRKGTGRAIINQLMVSAAERGVGTVWLEVIKGNEPAIELFLSSGFRPTRELVVARRPPDLGEIANNGASNRKAKTRVATLSRASALSLLEQRSHRPNWLNESESLNNLSDLQALFVECDGGAEGWVVFEPGNLQLKHIIVETITGEPANVTSSLLKTMHERYETQDAIMENLPANDAAWLGFEDSGYFDVFRRIEMVRNGHNP